MSLFDSVDYHDDEDDDDDDNDDDDGDDDDDDNDDNNDDGDDDVGDGVLELYAMIISSEYRLKNPRSKSEGTSNSGSSGLEYPGITIEW